MSAQVVVYTVASPWWTANDLQAFEPQGEQVPPHVSFLRFCDASTCEALQGQRSAWRVVPLNRSALPPPVCVARRLRSVGLDELERLRREVKLRPHRHAELRRFAKSLFVEANVIVRVASLPEIFLKVGDGRGGADLGVYDSAVGLRGEAQSALSGMLLELQRSKSTGQVGHGHGSGRTVGGLSTARRCVLGCAPAVATAIHAPAADGGRPGCLETCGASRADVGLYDAVHRQAEHYRRAATAASTTSYGAADGERASSARVVLRAHTARAWRFNEIWWRELSRGVPSEQLSLRWSATQAAEAPMAATSGTETTEATVTEAEAAEAAISGRTGRGHRRRFRAVSLGGDDAFAQAFGLARDNTARPADVLAQPGAVSTDSLSERLRLLRRKKLGMYGGGGKGRDDATKASVIKGEVADRRQPSCRADWPPWHNASVEAADSRMLAAQLAAEVGVACWRGGPLLCATKPEGVEPSVVPAEVAWPEKGTLVTFDIVDPPLPF